MKIRKWTAALAAAVTLTVCSAASAETVYFNDNPNLPRIAAAKTAKNDKMSGVFMDLETIDLEDMFEDGLGVKADFLTLDKGVTDMSTYHFRLSDEGEAWVYLDEGWYSVSDDANDSLRQAVGYIREDMGNEAHREKYLKRMDEIWDRKVKEEEEKARKARDEKRAKENPAGQKKGTPAEEEPLDVPSPTFAKVRPAEVKMPKKPEVARKPSGIVSDPAAEERNMKVTPPTADKNQNTAKEKENVFEKSQKNAAASKSNPEQKPAAASSNTAKKETKPEKADGKPVTLSQTTKAAAQKKTVDAPKFVPLKYIRSGDKIPLEAVALRAAGLKPISMEAEEPVVVTITETATVEIVSHS